MDTHFTSIPVNLAFKNIMLLMEESKETTFPVIDNDKLYGMLSFQDLRSILTQQALPELIIASDIATRDLITITTDENLNEALQKFGLKDLDMMPVINNNNPSKIIGILRRGDLMVYYNKRLLEKMAQ